MSDPASARANPGSSGARGISHRTTAGAAWLVGSRLLCRLADFLLLLIVGRLIGPAEFGLVAIAMTLVMIVEAVMELPLAHGLIRLPRLRPRHLDTAFTLSLLRGLLLTAILCLAAWPAALIYEDPRLFALIAALSLAPATRGMVSPAMTIFARQLDFRRDFIIEVLSKLVALAIAALIAITTGSYWALAAGTLATPVLLTILSYILAPYRPRLSLAEWRDFAAFLGWSSVAQGLAAINWQCDRLLLGRFTSRYELGQFSMASDLSFLPYQALIVPVRRPLTAAFTLVRHDHARLEDAYRKAVEAVLIVGAPLMIGLCLLAGPLIQLILGDKWGDAATDLQWLALATLPSLVVAPLGALAMALNRNRVFFEQAAAEFIVKLPAMVAGAMLYGVAGAIAVRIVSAIILAGISMLIVRNLIGRRIMQQLRDCGRTFTATVIMALFLLFARDWYHAAASAPLRIAVLGLTICAGGIVYTATAALLWRLSGRPAGVEAMLLERLAAWRGRRGRAEGNAATACG